MKLELKTAPAQNLISLADAKSWLVVENDQDDTTIQRIVGIVHSEAEAIMGRAIETQTWVEYLEGFPSSEIVLSKIQPTSITSIKYTDPDGVEQTWAPVNWEVDLKSLQARIRPITGKSFPATKDVYNSVYIEYSVGWPNMPDGIRGAMFKHLADLYENRETLLHTSREVLTAPEPIYWTYHRYRLNFV